MKINLKQYLDHRDHLREQQKPAGPILTLSREYGCESQKVVLKLLTFISAYYEHKPTVKPWQYVNKEIIEASSRELKIMPSTVKERVLSHGTNPVADIFSGFSYHYDLSDQKIIETVRDIIDTYSRNGNVIIIGRGGTQLTQHIPYSLHIKLMAPLNWRVQRIMSKKKLDKTGATQLINQIDRDRILWSEHLSNNPYNEEIFDVIINRETFSIEETARLILNLMIQKGLL